MPLIPDDNSSIQSSPAIPKENAKLQKAILSYAANAQDVLSNSFELVSRKAVQKQVTQPATVDKKKLGNILSILPRLLKQQDKVLLA